MVSKPLLTTTTLQIGCMRSSGFSLIYAIPAGMYAGQIWATPYLRLGTEMDNPLHRWILNVLQNLLWVKTTKPSQSILRECGFEPFQFNWFRATMHFYNSLTKCNSLVLKKVLHADISLSSRTDSCWASHLLSALDGLAHSDPMKHKIMACGPVNLSQFVVDLRPGHLGYWNQFTAPDPE
eukprot:565343-Pelagomonas_calceolata.AAC.1